MAKKNQTNTVIIGGGIAGLIAAATLEKAGVDYILFEASDEFGGLARGQQFQGVWLDYGLKSLPVGNMEENPLLKLKENLNLNFKVETLLDAPQTHTKNGFVDFVGFGETKNKKAIAELSYYMESPRFIVANGWKTLIDELTALIPEKKRKNKSHITKLEFEEDKISAAIVNADEKYTAENFIFTLAPSHLLALLPPGALSPKTVQKISKAETFAALSLDIATNKRMTVQKHMLLLNDDDLHVVGQFVTNNDVLRGSEGLQLSSWLCLLDMEDSKDDELVSKTLKHMKKLIKKAFPELATHTTWERIILSPSSHGGMVGISQQIINFYPIGGQYTDGSKYLSAAIEGAVKASKQIITRAASQAEKAMFESCGI